MGSGRIVRLDEQQQPSFSQILKTHETNIGILAGQLRQAQDAVLDLHNRVLVIEADHGIVEIKSVTAVESLIQSCQKYYDKPGNGVGGILHIVLDDENVDDENIKYCLGQAARKDDIPAVKIASELLGMSVEDRLAVVRGLSHVL